MLLINYSEGLGSLGSCWTLLHNPYSPFLVLTLGYPGRLHCNVLREVIHVDQSQDSKCVPHQQKFGQKPYFHLVDLQYLLIIFLIQLNRSERILWAALGHCRQDEVAYLLFRRVVLGFRNSSSKHLNHNFFSDMRKAMNL